MEEESRSKGLQQMDSTLFQTPEMLDLFIQEHPELLEHDLAYHKEERQTVSDQVLAREMQERVRVLIPAVKAPAEAFNTVYQDEISAGKRSRQANLAGTILHAKKKNAEKAATTEHAWTAAREGIAQKALAKARKKDRVEDFEAQDLKILSAFMDTTEQGEKLTKDFLSDGYETIRQCLFRFVEMKLDHLDFSTDESFLKECPRLLDFIKKGEAIQDVLKNNASVFYRLDKRTRDRISIQLTAAARLRGYYDARCAVLTNPYYQTHRNSEMTDVLHTDGASDEQTELNDLFLNLSVCEKVLLQDNPKGAADLVKKEREWGRFINTHRRVNYHEPNDHGMGTIMAPMMQLVSWLRRDKRTTQHGDTPEMLALSKQKYALLPDVTKQINGSQSVLYQRHPHAPAIDLKKYFKDQRKTDMAATIAQIRAMPGFDTFDAKLKEAVALLDQYTKIGGIVDSDTTEMEMTFLQRFVNLTNEWMMEDSASSFIPQLQTMMQGLLDSITEWGAGGLSASFQTAEEKAQYQYIIEHAEVLSEDTTYTSNMQQSNVRDIPLFLHTPNINDVKQSTIGDCWLVSAMTTLVSASPDAIHDMFQDLGDGTVLVRLYAIEDKNGNAIHNSGLSYPDGFVSIPQYFRIRKDYETGDGNANDCMWPQLLEKAYAAAGYNFAYFAKIEDGKMTNMAMELTNGNQAMALMHMTGKQCHESSLDASFDMMSYQIAGDTNKDIHDAIFAGMPHFMKERAIGLLQAQFQDPQSMYRHQYCFDEDSILDIVRTVYKGAAPAMDQRLQELTNKMMDKGGIAAEDVAEFMDRMITCMALDLTEDDYVARIRGNLEKMRNGEPVEHYVCESYTGSSADSWSDLFDEISDICDEETTPQERLAAINSAFHGFEISTPEKKVSEASARGKAIFEASAADLPAPDDPGFLSVCRKSAHAIGFHDPDMKYNMEQMRFYHECKAAIEAGGSVALVMSHCVSVIDVMEKDGEYWMLMKDPFNIYNIAYTGDAAAPSTQEGFGTVLRPHGNEIKRHLQTDPEETMHGGFRGLSWWKLKDLAALTHRFTILKKD